MTDKAIVRHGWQGGKTALQSHWYMFENDIATDISFEFTSIGNKLTSIRAHRLILMSRSEVFEGMFSSGMTDTNVRATIKITDTEPDVFRKMLRYMYLDQFEAAEETDWELLYCAQKYCIPQLVEKCSDAIAGRLNPGIFFITLEHSYFFNQTNLPEKCIQYLQQSSSQTSEEILKPENVIYSSRASLERILKLEKLAACEDKLYGALICWALMSWSDEQLRNVTLNTDKPTDQQLREVVGDMIYDIRFPVLDLYSFSHLASNCSILAEEEKSDIMHYIVDKQKSDTLKFRCDDRVGQWGNRSAEFYVDRRGENHANCGQQVPWSPGCDAINFQTDKPIILTGLGIYPESEQRSSGYFVDVEIFSGQVSCSKTVQFVQFSGQPNPQKVALTQPFLLQPGVAHTIVADSKGARKLFACNAYKSVCHEQGVNFTFDTTLGRGRNGSNVTRGQIPQIFFSLPK